MSDSDSRCTVRVWFGRHVMCEHTAGPSMAARYAAGMRQRFPGLDVTTEPAAPESPPPPLPDDERLWDLTVHGGELT